MRRPSFNKLLNVIIIIATTIIIIDNIQKAVYIKSLKRGIEQRDSLMTEYFHHVDEVIEFLMNKTE